MESVRHPLGVRRSKICDPNQLYFSERVNSVCESSETLLCSEYFAAFDIHKNDILLDLTSRSLARQKFVVKLDAGQSHLILTTAAAMIRIRFRLYLLSKNKQVFGYH